MDLATSRRVRFRLWWHRHLTGAGAWLIGHGRVGAAEALWRVTGLWSG